MAAPIHIRLNRDILLCMEGQRYGKRGQKIKACPEGLALRIIATGNGERITEADLDKK